MKCRSCNTRLSNGACTCPNCGHGERPSQFIDRPGSESPDGRPDEGREEFSPLSQSDAVAQADPEPVDIELSEEVELPLEEAMSSHHPVPPASPQVARGAARTSSPAPAPLVPTFPFSLEPAQLVQLVVEQPELLEPGLGLYVDDAGVEVGAHFATDVGEIDLLARDERRAIVVVMVAGSGPDRETISAMLRRIGWVRKHLTKGGQAVRGILVLEGMDEELGYAAAAVSDTIDFKTWRLALSFESIAV